MLGNHPYGDEIELALRMEPLHGKSHLLVDVAVLRKCAIWIYTHEPPAAIRKVAGQGGVVGKNLAATTDIQPLRMLGYKPLHRGFVVIFGSKVAKPPAQPRSPSTEDKSPYFSRKTSSRSAFVGSIRA